MTPARHSRTLWIVLALALVCGQAWSGPLYDPFLERFQVGDLSDPDDMELAAGLPSGLLEPARVDPNWLRTAKALTDTTQEPADDLLSRRLLAQVKSPAEIRTWLGRRYALLSTLRTDGQTESVLQPDEHVYLLGQRLAVAFFAAIRLGDLEQAQRLSERLYADGTSLGLNAREIFVWHLRALLIDRFLSGRGEIASGFWDSMRDLGGYDASNAWAIWVAHRRGLERPILPPELKTRDDGLFIGRLYKGWFGPDDLAASALGKDVKAGLGASKFSREDLGGHFLRFPDPPTDFTLQGWWVRGKRSYYRGDAARYEGLAERDDLKPGWVLDLRRRASERRLLKSEWKPGLADLRQALDLARADKGTRSQRRRLRHWVEQALVLAIAQKDSARAKEILDLGTATFSGEAGRVYADETAYWRHVLHGGATADYLTQEGHVLDIAARCVEAGAVPALTGATEASNQALLLAADQPLWDLWFKWGIALASVDGLDAKRQSRAARYRQWLDNGLSGATREQKIEAVVAAVTGRLAGRPELTELLEVALALDIQRAAHCQTPPLPSAVPDLLERLRGSQLDMHALLGFALLSKDMRGVLAVSTVLPGTGLSLNEKLRFLYPLPPPGTLRQAVLASGSEATLLLAVARNESLFEPAIRSRAGALGWMQIMPFHYTDRGARPGPENWRCPAVSVATGDRLLVENRRRFAGDPYLTLAAYNAGPGATERWRKQLGGNPSPEVYLAWIGYTETRHYVEKVLIDRYVYDWIISGEETSPPETN